jgi:hypothetical protein
MPFLARLTRIATTTSSNWAAARWKTSMWPNVTGSKDPGQTAPLMGDEATPAVQARSASSRRVSPYTRGCHGSQPAGHLSAAPAAARSTTATVDSCAQP